MAGIKMPVSLLRALEQQYRWVETCRPDLLTELAPMFVTARAMCALVVNQPSAALLRELRMALQAIAERLERAENAAVPDDDDGVLGEIREMLG